MGVKVYGDDSVVGVRVVVCVVWWGGCRGNGVYGRDSVVVMVMGIIW